MQTQLNPVSLVAGEAIEAKRRVKLNTSGQAVYADAYDRATHISDVYVASGDSGKFFVWGTGLHAVTASAACTLGTLLRGADDGKVSSAATGVVEGLCTIAAGTDGFAQLDTSARVDIPPQIVLASGSRTLLESESGATCTNLGAAGAVTFALPSAPSPNVTFHFYVQAAQELRIDPGSSDKILYLISLAPADGEYVTANAAGEWVQLKANTNGDWVAQGYGGTWTEETP